MLAEKKVLSLDEIEAQTALELPDREELALINVFITNVLNNLTVNVVVQNNKVAAQVCAVVNLINTLVAPNQLTCTIMQ